MAASYLFVLALMAAQPAVLLAAEQQESAHMNPIRKVVTMLQRIQAKVHEEGKTEKELYEKFMCYCKNSRKGLEEDIAAAEKKIPELEAAIKEAEAEKGNLKAEIEKAKKDRDAANTAMKEATGLREKEAAAYAKENADSLANIAAIKKAVSALEKGVAGSFLQSVTARTVRQLAITKDLVDDDRQTLLSFLSGAQTSEYSPQSGQIIGILKQMGDEISKGLEEATAAENEAIQIYEELMAAKKKEVDALQAQIEDKMTRLGDGGVHIAEMKNDLEDTKESLEEDKKFLAELEKGCSTKTAEYEENVRIRNEEILALSETIKLLNDDDALELFKKTLPGAGASLIQVQVSNAATKKRALEAIKAARDHPRLDFIELALHGSKIGFGKIIEMIDKLVATLKKEQVDDDAKKAYCAAEFDTSDDKKKALEHSVADAEKAIAQAEDSVAMLTEEIAALEAGIKALDEAVVEATAQRKEEHDAFTELIASDTAAVDLLHFAKNRLNKFYAPKLYKPAAKVELTEAERITVSMGGTAPPTEAPGGIAGTSIGKATSLVQVFSHEQVKDAPPPPPETFGAYTKKGEMSHGVIAMIDLLVQDLDKEMQTADVAEKDAQEDYETMMKASAEKRQQDSKTLSDKEMAKAETEKALEAHKEAKAEAVELLGETLQYIHALHLECDWLLEYFDVRKEARTAEIDALENAKAVLSGADYSLVQTGTRGYLRRAA